MNRIGCLTILKLVKYANKIYIEWVAMVVLME